MLTCQLTKKIIKSTITTCTTLRNNHVSLTSSKCRFHEKINICPARFGKTVDVDVDAVWSGGLAGSMDEAVRRDWRLPHEKVYRTRITDLDDLKHRIRTEWAKLDHAVIAAAVHQWRRRLSACVKAGGGHFEHCF